MKLLIISVIVSIFSFYKPAPTEYPYKTLSWSDFRGVPDSSATDVLAVTYSSINIVTVNEKNRVSWSISAGFYPDSSYTKTFRSDILRHEQLHFDITQIFAQKINKFLIPYQNCSIRKSKSVEHIISTYVTEWRKVETKYDKETNFSRDRFQQSAWDIKITKMLNN